MDEFKVIPLHQLVPSPTNPRKHFPENSIIELAESIKSVGVVENLVVRQISQGHGSHNPLAADMYEIVCGERRYKASKLAGIEEVPCMVRTLTDDQVFDIQITENLQREDVNPLDEAEAFQALMNKKRYGLEELAVRFGKSTDYIFGRMRLTNLIPEAKALLDEGILPVTAGIRIAMMVDPTQQEAAIKRTIVPIKTDKIDTKVFTGLKDLKTFIDNNVLLPLKLADFDISDAKLVPECGSCDVCPKRTGNNLYKEFSESDRCLDNSCYKRKHIEHYRRLQKRLSEQHKVTVGFAARLYAAEKEFPELEAIPLMEWELIDESVARKTKNSRLVIFVGPDRIRNENSSLYGWIRVKEPKVAAKPMTKEEKEKKKAKDDREMMKHRLYQQSLHIQYLDNAIKVNKLTDITLKQLIASTWNDINIFPQEMLLDIVKRYNLTIHCEKMGTLDEVTIDKNTTFSTEISYSVGFIEVLEAIQDVNDIGKLSRLLNELVFIRHIDDDVVLKYYNVDKKAASKNATALMKESK